MSSPPDTLTPLSNSRLVSLSPIFQEECYKAALIMGRGLEDIVEDRKIDSSHKQPHEIVVVVIVVVVVVAAVAVAAVAVVVVVVYLRALVSVPLHMHVRV